ncbi:penicillin-binding protein 1A [Aquabacterium sp. OR-4]|uniref:penicillin-binding protein 1A n=1 Tax=Aquabacterium sp. OR-4 TaxID=2978127 RepID=UPI0028C5A556|nr:PBP1A family penicillin-binding protein [Aquabacterium sp. OR-4]MDT7833883.1 PBP1A family penicillin-binding protein [Aquabacterium sp. OR-4]
MSAPLTRLSRLLPRRPWLRRALIGAGATLAAGALALGLAVAWYLPQLPSLEPVTTYQPRQQLQVFTADGVEIAAFGTERRVFVPIEQMPPALVKAVLATEDARFYRHSGIDWLGVARAIAAQLTGGMRQGASTITQQVARTFFLSQRFTPERKIKEALLALRIERKLSKDKILELYLNQIYLGQRSYGFAAAADTYFGKPLAQITLAEAAMLAGLPQNPAFANPITNLERATRRQRIVLARMVATGDISAEQQAAAKTQVLAIGKPREAVLHAEYVAEMARRTVVERFGTEAYSQGLRVVTALRAADQQAAWAALRRGVLAHDQRQAWRGPENQVELPRDDAPDLDQAAGQALKDVRDDDVLRAAVVLAASPREVMALLASGERVRISGEGLRRAAAGLVPKAPDELAIRRGAVIRVMQANAAAAARPGEAAAGPWGIVQWPEVEAALVALDAGSGRVRALVGGFDFQQQPFNHVTQAWRQPGSSLKPFLYSAALEEGVMPGTLVNDAPLSFGDGWQPQNSDGSFDGPITLRQALTRSKNLVSIRVLQQLGVPPALAWLRRYGFESARQPSDLTLALGAGGTTPMQLAQAYAVLANGGWRVSPVLIEKITDAQGKLLFQAPPAAAQPDEAQRALPARNVFLVNSMLNDVARYGTAARAQGQLARGDLYGKTGTTNDAVDAWFAGFQAGVGADGQQRGLVAVVWMGHDQPRSLGARESGGGLALPIWIDYMARALDGVPAAAPLPAPEGLLREDGGDWRYADAAFVPTIGLDADAAAAAEAAASEAGGAASGAALAPQSGGPALAPSPVQSPTQSPAPSPAPAGASPLPPAAAAAGQAPGSAPR